AASAHPEVAPGQLEPQGDWHRPEFRMPSCLPRMGRAAWYCHKQLSPKEGPCFAQIARRTGSWRGPFWILSEIVFGKDRRIALPRAFGKQIRRDERCIRDQRSRGYLARLPHLTCTFSQGTCTLPYSAHRVASRVNKRLGVGIPDQLRFSICRRSECR